MPDKVEQTTVAARWRQRGFSCELWVDPPGQVWADFVHPVDELVMVVDGDSGVRDRWRRSPSGARRRAADPGTSQPHRPHQGTRRLAMAVRLQTLTLAAASVSEAGQS